MNPVMDCICFRLGGESYAHDVLSVREIMRYEQPTPVPGAPSEVEGILNVRGEVVTVVSGHRLLGLMVPEVCDPDWRIVILESVNGWLAISVESVDEIVQINGQRLQPLNSSSDLSFVRGTIRKEGRLLIVTDLVEVE